MDYINLLASLVSLIILEIVLGIDNLVFLSIMTEQLPETQRKKARRFGLSLAWIFRLILLACAVFLVTLTRPLLGFFSIRDLFLFCGGLFLIWKATEEIHYDLLQEAPNIRSKTKTKTSFTLTVLQIAIMDIIFSLDSVLTAIGLSNQLWVMSIAITCAILIMLYASEGVNGFIARYPTIKILALSFLILIGMVLVADSFSLHIPRGYVYFAMGFSLAVEALNLIKRKGQR